MAITAVLVEATPFLLKYLLTAASAASNGSATADGNLTINNALGVSPDLATDAKTGTAAAESVGRGNTIQSVVNARRLGYGPIAAGATCTQAQARALLNSDDASNAVITNKNVMSCEMSIQNRTTSNLSVMRQTNDPGSADLNPPTWNVDASIDASTNPIVIVKLAQLVSHPVTAYLTIRCRHSFNW